MWAPFNIFVVRTLLLRTYIKMLKQIFYFFLLALSFVLVAGPCCAQQKINTNDTFFLAKKKGLLGKFGRSISINTAPEAPPENSQSLFKKYKGKIIHSIIIVPVDIGSNFYDTNVVENTFLIRLARTFHRNSSEKVISRNLFFKEGDRLFPILLADNERYLRELVFIQDARILVAYAENTTDSVDVIVITKDNFSITGKIVISNNTRGRAEAAEENFAGSGNRISANVFYDENRKAKFGYGAEITRRNMWGSFINWTTGYQNYKKAFNSGSNIETTIYTRLEKPLITPFIPNTGSLDISYNKTTNGYVSDSLYNAEIKYEDYNIDGWFGFSLDRKRTLYFNREKKVHRFVAVRGFHQKFLSAPLRTKIIFDYNYADFTGVMASFNIFKQLFYKTTFIYGFGSSEDIPEGYSLAFTAGYTKKGTIKRPYAGIDVQYNILKKRGAYFNYILRVGGYFYKTRFEDVDFLFNLEHFTRLKKLNSYWYHRILVNTGITAQVNPVLNKPLFLSSEYGFPFFNSQTITGDLRATGKIESVFYNTKRVLGFRFAPFIFADIILLKPTKAGVDKSDIFSALGGGVRTRNENFIFGTIELKGYYYPRTLGNMQNWKIDLNSDIQFKYKSSYIRRPDFVIVN